MGGALGMRTTLALKIFVYKDVVSLLITVNNNNNNVELSYCSILWMAGFFDLVIDH